MASARSGLAGWVALAYTGVIAYASLLPFSGWRAPPEEVLHFLSAPWPRYVTAGDVLLNVAAYLPLGAMLFATMRPRASPLAAVAVATLLGAGLSLILECMQMFLPTRIASNVDLLSNAFGAGIGAFAALVFELQSRRGSGLAALRQRWLRTDAAGDAALIVVVLWIVIQINQAPLAFSGGDVRDTFGIAPWFAHAPYSYLLAEAAIVALALTSVGLLVALIVRPERGAWPAVTLALALGAAIKTGAVAVLSNSAFALQWLTPGVLLGAAAALALLVLATRLQPAPRAAVAAACVAGGVLLVNITPENPYQSAPLFMLSAQTTHLVNFSHIVRAASQLWPLLALAMLAALAAKR